MYVFGVVGDPCQALKIPAGSDNHPGIRKEVGCLIQMFRCDDRG